MNSRTMKRATAFAPATVANVAVGFDLLGFAVDCVGDRVTVETTPQSGVIIESIQGTDSKIPHDPTRNTATAGLIRLLEDVASPLGLKVILKKGIAMSSGMGGSAASAVAAIHAANEALELELSLEKQMEYALIGESVASGGKHGDNVAPALFGGLTLCRSVDPVDVIRIPVPAGFECVLIHPDLEVSTRESRAKLSPQISLKDHVLQSASLAGFISGCFQNDLTLIARSMNDRIIEPQRAGQIPGMLEAKKAAMDLGALGCSISGSGPSVFAWVKKDGSSRLIETAMIAEFKKKGIPCQSWISDPSPMGVRIVS